MKTKVSVWIALLSLAMTRIGKVITRVIMVETRMGKIMTGIVMAETALEEIEIIVNEFKFPIFIYISSIQFNIFLTTDLIGKINSIIKASN
ncbi:MAG: hypothetical protein LBR28_02340 [Bacteroidales bacterium]|jgi:hypothetical protein|nr:hypothetical protein [Bacteroidales bacterium]